MDNSHTITRFSATRVAGIVGTGPWASPAYESLTAELSRAISDGRLPVGVRLPSERELAAQIGLSRTTTTRAYALLRDKGYIVTRRGSGSIVQLPDIPGGRVDHLLAPVGLSDDVIDLTCTAPMAPPGMMSAYQSAFEQLQAYLPGTGYYPSGVPILKERVAERFAQRGLSTDPEQILITAGALGGVAIAARALLSGRARVVIESPTYANAIATFEASGANLITYPLEVTANGHHWDPQAYTQLITSSGAKVAYMIPDFHNPTGALMPTEVRAEIGAMLRRNKVVPIIDESLVDLELDGAQTPPPLAAFVPDSVTIGSASKSYWGGLRIGWMRVPMARVEAMASSRLSLDTGAPVLEQLVTAELMLDHDELQRASQERLRRSRDILIDQVRTH